MPEVTSMWFYLFASNEKYPEPESEIRVWQNWTRGANGST